MQYFLLEMNVNGPHMETLIPTVVAAEHEADAFEVGEADNANAFEESDDEEEEA